MKGASISMFWVEWNLHKDGSWIAQGFKTEQERENQIKELKSLGYNPRRSKDGKQR